MSASDKQMASTPRTSEEQPMPSTSAVSDDVSTATASVTTPIIKPATSTTSDPEAAGAGGKSAVGAKASVQIREPPVSETRGYSIVKVEEKHGPMYMAIPTMPLPLAVLFCLFNIVLPGIGTLMSAFTVFCCGRSKMTRPCRAFGYNILAAVLQIITFVVIVGWIWSIRWGMTFVQHSLSTKDAKNSAATPYYVRRQSSVDYEKQHSHHSKA